MIRAISIFLCFGFILNVAQAQTHDAVIESGSIRAAVYYPAGYSGSDANKVKWPALFFAHGFAGSALSQDILLDKLSGLGMLVVAIDHNDPVAFERIPPGKADRNWKILRYMKNHPFTEEVYSYRHREFKRFIKLAMDQLPVDESRVIFSGHSMGGYSILNSIENPYVTPRALIIYSCGELNYRHGHPYFTEQQLQALKPPLILFYGENEFDPDKGPYAREIARHYGGNARLHMVKEGTHLSYTDPNHQWQKQKRLQQIEHIYQETKRFLEALTLLEK